MSDEAFEVIWEEATNADSAVYPPSAKRMARRVADIVTLQVEVRMREPLPPGICKHAHPRACLIAEIDSGTPESPKEVGDFYCSACRDIEQAEAEIVRLQGNLMACETTSEIRAIKLQEAEARNEKVVGEGHD